MCMTDRSQFSGAAARQLSSARAMHSVQAPAQCYFLCTVSQPESRRGPIGGIQSDLCSRNVKISLGSQIKCMHFLKMKTNKMYLSYLIKFYIYVSAFSSTCDTNILQFFWTITITCTSKSNKFAVVTSSKEWFNSDYTSPSSSSPSLPLSLTSSLELFSSTSMSKFSRTSSRSDIVMR